MTKEPFKHLQVFAPNEQEIKSGNKRGGAWKVFVTNVVELLPV